MNFLHRLGSKNKLSFRAVDWGTLKFEFFPGSYHGLVVLIVNL